VRLVDAPGELGGVELEVLGWRTERGETVLRCRLIDGSVGTIPARWTDLPRSSVQERPLGELASPQGVAAAGRAARAAASAASGAGRSLR